MLLLLAAVMALAAQAQPSLPDILSRVAEEAEMLRENAPKSLTQETLQQRTLLPPPRFHPRIGQGAIQAPKPRAQLRTIVSEYSIGPLHESGSQELVEFRQVISVDGRPVQSQAEARHALSLGIQAPDDRIRKRMLEDFARHGLVDVATDFGLILLEFSKRGLPQLKIEPASEANIGPDPALGISWRQLSGAGGALEFAGRQAGRYPLAGKLYVRKSDGLPLRVDAWTEHTDAARHRIRDEAAVDYAQTAHGFLAPVKVEHHHMVDGALTTTNVYTYEPFKLFGADAEIKFTELPEQAPSPDAPKQ